MLSHKHILCFKTSSQSDMLYHHEKINHKSTEKKKNQKLTSTFDLFLTFDFQNMKKHSVICTAMELELLF